MRAIVIKPKICCGNTVGLGGVIEVTSPEPQYSGTGIANCQDCHKKWVDHASNFFLNLDTGFLIEKARVKILPDDLGDELITETSEEQTA